MHSYCSCSVGLCWLLPLVVSELSVSFGVEIIVPTIFHSYFFQCEVVTLFYQQVKILHISYMYSVVQEHFHKHLFTEYIRHS